MPGFKKKIIIVSLLNCFIVGFLIFGSNKVLAADPVGFFDSADCTQMTGWSVDPNYLNSPNQVGIFADGPAGSGILLGYVPANRPRTSGLCQFVGGSNCSVCDSDPTQPQCAHGFIFQTPASLKDGQTHQIYVHGMHYDNQGNNPLLQSVPKSLTCSGAPTPPPVSYSCSVSGPTSVTAGNTVNYTINNVSGSPVRTQLFYIPTSQQNNQGAWRLAGSCGSNGCTLPITFPSADNYYVVCNAQDCTDSDPFQCGNKCSGNPWLPLSSGWYSCGGSPTMTVNVTSASVPTPTPDNNPPKLKQPTASYQMIEPNSGVGTYRADIGNWVLQANSSWNSNLPKMVSDGTYLYSLVSMGDQAMSLRGEMGLEIRRKRLNSNEDFVTIWSKPSGLYRVVGGLAMDKNGSLHVFYYLSSGYLQHEIATSPQASSVYFSPDTSQPINQHCGNCRLGIMYDYPSDNLYVVSDQVINSGDIWAASYLAVYHNGSWSGSEKIMDWPFDRSNNDAVYTYIYPKLIIFNGKLHIFFNYYQYNASGLSWFKSIIHYYKDLGSSIWNAEMIKDSSIPSNEQAFVNDAFVTKDGKLAIVGVYNRCPSGNCWDGSGTIQTLEFTSSTGVGGWQQLIISPYFNYSGICVQKTSDSLYHMFKMKPYDKLEYAQSPDGVNWTDFLLSNPPNISQIGYACLEENGIFHDKAYGYLDGYSAGQPTNDSNGNTVLFSEVSFPVQPTSTPIPPSPTPIPPTSTPIPPSPTLIPPTPTSTPTPIPGDITGKDGVPDGKVDIYDYNLLIRDFGLSAQAGKPGSPADIDGNGIVNIFDYNTLIGNFGKGNQ